MILKIIIIFLLAMALIGMIGSALFLGALRRGAAPRRKVSLCPNCGRPIVGKSGCDCSKKG